MGLTIIRDLPYTHSLDGEQLKDGQIYEGSDGLLYAGCRLKLEVGQLLAVGIGHDSFVDDTPGDYPISFREIETVINVKN